jgi:translation initiation factor eIF-2B subunit delta
MAIVSVQVMICTETNKFIDKVLLDSICQNELGDTKEIAEPSAELAAAGLHTVNLIYDVLPAEYITMIITEVGMIPPTSVPVILREYRSEPSM